MSQSTNTNVLGPIVSLPIEPQIDSDIMWFATGTGVLNNNDATRIYAASISDVQARNAIPTTANLTMFWKAVGDTTDEPVHLNLDQSYLEFTSGDYDDPTVTDSLKFSDSVNDPSIGSSNFLSSLITTGNEITDDTRIAGASGDGRDPESSFGVWNKTTNLLINGGFETDLSGWQGINNASLSRISTTPKFGTWCLEVTNDGTQADQAVQYNGMSGSKTSGAYYTGSAWVKLISGSGSAYISLDDTVGHSDSTPVTLTTDWTRLSITRIWQSFDPGTLSIHISGTAVVSFGVDGAQVEQNAIATPYVETNKSQANRLTPWIQADAGLLDKNSGWVAVRVRIEREIDANSSGSGVFLLTDSLANNGIVLYHQPGANVFKMYSRINGTPGLDDVNVTASAIAGTEYTVIAQWDLTTHSLSVDGSPFTNVARANGIPPGNLNTFTIGSLMPWLINANLDGEILWFACGTGTLSNADVALIHETLSTRDPLNLYDPFNATNFPTMVWPATNTNAFRQSSLVNTYLKYNRNSLTHVDLSNITGIRLRLVSTGDMLFKAQALRQYKLGEWAHPSIAIDTKNNVLGRQVQQAGANVTEDMSDNDIILFPSRPKNISQVAKFNSGHNPPTGYTNDLRILGRWDSINNSGLFAELSISDAGFIISLVERVSGVDSTIFTSPLQAALTEESDYAFILDLFDEDISASVYEVRGAFFGNLRYSTGTKTVPSIFTRGSVGYYLAPYYYDFTIDWIQNQRAEFATYESLSLASLTPVIGATIYPQNSLPIDISGQDFIPSGDATFNLDLTFGDPAPSQRFDRTGTEFFGGLQTRDFLYIGDTKHLTLSGRIYPSQTLDRIYRVVLIDKYDTVAWIHYLENLKSNQWNSFEIPINSNIIPTNYRLAIQGIGFYSDSFWIEDLKFSHNMVAWSVSADDGTHWYNFFDQTGQQYHSVNFGLNSGTQLRVKATALSDSAWIGPYSVEPHYSYIGHNNT